MVRQRCIPVLQCCDCMSMRKKEISGWKFAKDTFHNSFFPSRYC